VRTELHFHLLPGVDDGPRDEREALELARLAVQDGTGRVVTTPHVGQMDLSELPERVRRLRALLADAGVPLEVSGGGEISPTDAAALTDDDLELIAQGPSDARWLLLEAPLWRDPDSLRRAADALRARGYALLIGHPERSSGITIEELEAYVRSGSALQLNASSLAGLHGPMSARAALAIAQSGLPFILASDAHSVARPPLLRRGAETLRAAGVSPEAIRVAVDTGAESLFETGRLDAGAPRLDADPPQRAA
jgi:protein-tyrosine phosphatase